MGDAAPPEMPRLDGSGPFRREGSGLEFERFAFFADAVYAIAMTLIVVGVEVPKIGDANDAGELWSALGDLGGQIVMFFIAFYVIGQYWLGHHRFVASLRAIDATLLSTQLAYLAFVAFLPFPAQLMGEYGDNPVGVSSLAVAMAVVSAMEVLQLVVARRHGLLRLPLTDEGARWQVLGAASPVVVLLVSVPLAFVDPWLAIAAWVANAPVGMWLERHRPDQMYAPGGTGPSDAAPG